MHPSWLRHLVSLLLQYGALGLFILTVADASFLFLPIGADLLTVVLVARNRDHLPLYVLAAAGGSMIGALLLDLVARKGGEEGLEHLLKPKQLAYLKQHVQRDAAVALIVSSLAPPPFPFTATLAAASAFQYPRAKYLSVIFVARLVRFSLVGWAAIHFGRRILKIAQTPEFFWTMVGFATFCIIGSVFQILRWTRRSKAKV